MCGTGLEDLRGRAPGVPEGFQAGAGEGAESEVERRDLAILNIGGGWNRSLQSHKLNDNSSNDGPKVDR